MANRRRRSPGTKDASAGSSGQAAGGARERHQPAAPAAQRDQGRAQRPPPGGTADTPAPVAARAAQPSGRRTAGRGPKGQRRGGAGTLGVVGAAVLLAVIIAVIVTRSLHRGPSVKLNETYQAPTAGGIHVAEGSAIQYAYTPPSSGPHYPSPTGWGFYGQVVPPGTWVHNLEHGGIAVLYRCPSDCAALQSQLQALYDQLPHDPHFQERKAVITPYPDLDHLLRIQAWGWTMPLDTVDTAAIDAFYTEHVDKGPELVQ